MHLTRRERRAFGREGFAVVDRPVLPQEDLAEVRCLLDALFARFDELPPDLAYDLGDVQHHDGRRQTPEINVPSQFEPRLRRSALFARCAEVASELLGADARWAYDHAILKPPHNGASVEWHQDLATAPQLERRATVHMWIPLQDATTENGCMQFVPVRGERPLLPHTPRAPAAHALVARGIDARDAVVCPVRAGGFTLHDLRTLHRTGPNATSEPRLAWILHFHRERGASRGRGAASVSG